MNYSITMLIFLLFVGTVSQAADLPASKCWVKELTVTQDEKQIVLKWQKQTDSSFNKVTVYRKSGSDMAERNRKGLNEYAVLPGDADIYIDQSAEPGLLYFYSIGGQSKNGEKCRQSPVRVGMVKDFTPPDPVRNFQAQINDQAIITLNWEPASDNDVVSYQVYRGVENQRSLQPMLVIGAGEQLQLQDKVDPLSPFAFLYSVAAVDASGNESPMSPIQRVVVPDQRAPEKPFITNLIPTSDGIKLSWSASQSSDVQGYNVNRKNVTDHGTFQKLTKTPLAAVQFNDSTAVFGKTYSYYVTAVDQAGNESASSGELSCRAITAITIKTPEGLKLVITKENKRQLNWPGKEPSVRGYLVERSPDELNDFRRISPLLPTTSFIDGEQTGKKQLVYRILALYDDGQVSPPSAPVLWRAAPEKETKK